MKILFVCLGNICRSPLAEAIFNHQVKELGLEGKFEVDSCGINSYHTGELADPRTRATAESFGISITHRARTFKIKDFDNYDHIFVMDKSNFDALLQFRPNDKVIQKIRFLRHFDPLSEGSEIVPDPYYGKQADFINVHQIITRSIKELLIQLQSKI